jgi:putative FmdB family regulatory protein
MPLYEYVCETDGERIELLRPMAQADAPVDDPKGEGRRFRRVHSTFAAQGGEPGSSKGRTVSIGGGCACGKPHGCGSH